MAVTRHGTRLDNRCVGSTLSMQYFQLPVTLRFRGALNSRLDPLNDEFIGDEIRINHHFKRVLSDDLGNRSNPLSKIDDDLIVEWCETNPIVRYPLVAAAIKPYQVGESDKELAWTPLAKKIIINSSDPIVILNKFKEAFRPMSWSGSRADVLQKRLCLITDFKNHEYPLVAQWADREEVEFKNEIFSEKKEELERERGRDERFE